MKKQLTKTTLDFNQARKNQEKGVSVVNLGCARNLVDSQVILGH